MNKTIDSDQLLSRLENKGPAIKEYAKAKADRVYIDQYRKSLKAILMEKARENGAKTGIERETYAYAHRDYLDLLNALRNAVEIEEKHRWTLENLKIMFEVWRTTQANERYVKDRV